MIRKFDVYLCGVFCLTVTAYIEQEAFSKACDALGLDSDDGAVEVFEVPA